MWKELLALKACDFIQSCSKGNLDPWLRLAFRMPARIVFICRDIQISSQAFGKLLPSYANESFTESFSSSKSPEERGEVKHPS